MLENGLLDGNVGLASWRLGEVGWLGWLHALKRAISCLLTGFLCLDK
jgi:hypothetical protein